MGGLWGASGLAASRRRRGAGQPRSVGRSPAAGCRRPKDGAGQRPGGAWLEFLCLARCVGLEGGKRSSTKAQPQGEGGGTKIPKIPIIVDVI